MSGWECPPTRRCLARDLARRALELDPDLPEAHAYLGFVAGMYDLDCTEAERHFHRAMVQEPVHWHVRAWYSCFYLFPVGRILEARREAERVIDDNPLSQICHWDLAIVLEGLGLEAKAEAEWRRCVELDPDFWLGWTALGLHHAVYGNHAEARDCGEKAFALFPSSPYVGGLLAGALEATGESARAQALLSGVLASSSGTPVAHAYYHLVRGEIVEWAGKAMDERNFMLISVMIRPFEQVLGKSPVWPGLLKKFGLSSCRAIES